MLIAGGRGKESMKCEYVICIAIYPGHGKET
jgi:hypothetical protein